MEHAAERRAELTVSRHVFPCSKPGYVAFEAALRLDDASVGHASKKTGETTG